MKAEIRLVKTEEALQDLITDIKLQGFDYGVYSCTIHDKPKNKKANGAYSAFFIVVYGGCQYLKIKRVRK